MVGIALRYLLIDCCIECLFTKIERCINIPITQPKESWSICVGDRFTEVIVYRNSVETTYQSCKIIDNYYENSCWFILIKYDAPKGLVNSTWIAYPDIIRMYLIS